MTVAKRYSRPTVEIETVCLLISITILNPERKVIKSIVLNDVLHALESKESQISEPCLTERVLKVKFDQFGALITGQHGVEGTVKRVDLMEVIYECNDNSAHIVTNSDI